jgi:hypothetical protein
VNRLIQGTIDDLGGNPYIVPSQAALQERIQEYNPVTEEGKLVRDLVGDSIMGFPFGTEAEKFEISNGNTVRITHEGRTKGTAGQFNISTFSTDTKPVGLYRREEVEVPESESVVTFDELPESSAFRRNAMFASEQYMTNEEKLIALGVSPEVLQERAYEEVSFSGFQLYSNVDLENRERVSELYTANQDILDRFDFSRVPFRTVKKHADQFLRDANEAYRLLDLKKEEWVIDKVGNVMSSPSLLEPDFEDASPEAKAVQNLLTERYNFIEDDIGNPLREEAIAALMGNIHVETGGSFDYRQLQNQGPAYGLFQFDDKKANYDTWLVENNKQDSASSQIDFVYDTIYGDSQDIIGAGVAGRLRDVFETGTVEEITAAFSLLWERPNPQKANQDRRIEESNKYFSIFSP